mmetsp:Transcript_38478/g.81777  ORF Transcript_38478/g.81777 Transcript_38478/m.81777 type:complete len:118 (+) Transcript_38478:465-818(+)
MPELVRYMLRKLFRTCKDLCITGCCSASHSRSVYTLDFRLLLPMDTSKLRHYMVRTFLCAYKSHCVVLPTMAVQLTCLICDACSSTTLFIAMAMAAVAAAVPFLPTTDLLTRWISSA